MEDKKRKIFQTRKDENMSGCLSAYIRETILSINKVIVQELNH
jgi:hypothetical protein